MASGGFERPQHQDKAHYTLLVDSPPSWPREHLPPSHPVLYDPSTHLNPFPFPRGLLLTLFHSSLEKKKKKMAAMVPSLMMQAQFSGVESRNTIVCDNGTGVCSPLLLSSSFCASHSSFPVAHLETLKGMCLRMGECDCRFFFSFLFFLVLSVQVDGG